MIWTVFVFSIAGATASSAQTFNILANFGPNGFSPRTPLVQGFDGNFYGTDSGGCIACGMVFKMAPNGTLTTLHGFEQTGATPEGLILGTDGNLYSTTYGGGTNSDGTVFKITPSGTVTLLHSFDTNDGYLPQAGVIQGTDGNFYGTTLGGGANVDGTVFKITPSGTLTTLYSFCGQTNCTDGEYAVAGLVQGTDGNFYSAAEAGGANGYGTVFKMTPSGTLTTLYSFCSQTNCADGKYPSVALIQATDGNFYGTTPQGGTEGYGTIFKITAEGALTTLYSFCSQTNCTDGESPVAGLVQATDGNFYGTTPQGGTKGYGTIFKITAEGTLTTLYSFCVRTGCADGGSPGGGLMQATNGKFYGTTSVGGATHNNICSHGCGTAFSVGVGLAPFVETNPTSGKVGSKVIVLGNNLNGATGVTFNGTAATLLRVTSSAIQTSVPIGATSGTLVVTTPNGTLNSNVAFRVP
jgi:uncharacterized repeat protein (TIGR03803 family)